MLSAATYIPLTAQWTPAKAAYFDRLSRLSPEMLRRRAFARQWVGDFAGSADDVQALIELQAGFRPDLAEPVLLAEHAAYLSLAGKREAADAAAARARAVIEDQISNGKALNNGAAVNIAEEMLDFQAVAKLLADGKAAEARAAFTGRSRWTAPTAPAVAFLAGKLREGAAPAELRGALARSPEQIRAEGLQTQAGSAVQKYATDAALFQILRPPVSAGDYGPARAAWKADKSRYLLKRTGKEVYQGEVVSMFNVYGLPAGEALLLQGAAIAQSRGKTGFVLAPGRKMLSLSIMRFGNPGEPGFPAEAVLDAKTVMAAVSAKIPNPNDKAAN
jgi:hypothetical protein